MAVRSYCFIYELHRQKDAPVPTATTQTFQNYLSPGQSPYCIEESNLEISSQFFSTSSKLPGLTTSPILEGSIA